MKNMINGTHVEGLLYQHKIELKESGPQSKNPGTKFFSGTIDIATDNNLTNIVTVHFTYVTEKTSTGKTNRTYNVLDNIYSGHYPTVMKDGADKAAVIKVDSAIGLNEFYSNRNGEEELVSVKRNEGGFVNIGGTLDENEKMRNTFKCDMLITGCKRIEGDPEKNTSDKVEVRGAIFDFRGSLLPVTFSVIHEGGMAYFEGLNASNKEPVFTTVWGNQISETIVKTYTEESAFGDSYVRTVPSSRKDFVITGASREPYAWDDESTITAQELQTKMSDRATYLATIKQRQDEYNASKNQASAAPAAAAGGFNF